VSTLPFAAPYYDKREKIMTKHFTLTAIGNALVDITYTTTDHFIKQHGLVKGQMALSSPEDIERMTKELTQRGVTAGGSCANSMVSFCELGGNGAFIGKIAEDDCGKMFQHEMDKADVHFSASTGDGATGTCAILVSPDAVRTMMTSLGIAGTLGPEDVDENLIHESSALYLEGYLYDEPCAKEAFDKAALVIKQNKGIVALSLSDLFCVERHREDFMYFTKNHCDIVFANEAEACALLQSTNLAEIIPSLQGLVPIICVTREAQGALIITKSDIIEIAAIAPDGVVDTTGAGDSWAAGFLYGYTHNLSLEQSGQLGAMTAGEVIGHFGAQPQHSLKERMAHLLR
jgi:sugar/nucleoside kinase (ribokinase family)